MFTIQIQCATIEDAEKILATLKFGATPARGHELSGIGSDSSDNALVIENDIPPMPGTLDAARAALKALQQRHGVDNMEVPLLVLGRFDAGRVSEVWPEDYAAFVAACEAA